MPQMHSSDAPRPAQVMIIEDEPVVAADIAASVEAGGGIVVAYATTAREAVDVAQQVEIDLLLSDVRLADNSDGIEASATIQARCDAPVAFVTASVDDETVARMRRLDPLAILHKPVSESDIFALLDRVHGAMPAAGPTDTASKTRSSAGPTNSENCDRDGGGRSWVVAVLRGGTRICV